MLLELKLERGHSRAENFGVVVVSRAVTVEPVGIFEPVQADAVTVRVDW